MTTPGSRELAARRCVPCRGGTEPLRGAALAALLAQLGGGWRVVDEHHLEKEFRFRDFAGALAFANEIGALAEEQSRTIRICTSRGASSGSRSGRTRSTASRRAISCSPRRSTNSSRRETSRRSPPRRGACRRPGSGRESSCCVGVGHRAALDGAQHRVHGEVGHARALGVEERPRAEQVHEIVEAVADAARRSPSPAAPRCRRRAATRSSRRSIAIRASPSRVRPRGGLGRLALLSDPLPAAGSRRGRTRRPSPRAGAAAPRSWARRRAAAGAGTARRGAAGSRSNPRSARRRS